MARLGWVPAVLTLAVLGFSQRVALDDPPPALYLTFTNLVAPWQVEATTDLTNWHTIVLSGELPPAEFSLQLSNAGQAQFYRVTARP